MLWVSSTIVCGSVGSVFVSIARTRTDRQPFKGHTAYALNTRTHTDYPFAEDHNDGGTHARKLFGTNPRNTER